MQTPLLCETAMSESRPDASSKSGPETRPDTSAESGPKSSLQPESEASALRGSLPGSESTDADARLEKLELKLMDMEIVLQQLNDVILQQYHDIEKLRNAHGALQKQLDSARENAVVPLPADEVPPHY